MNKYGSGRKMNKTQAFNDVGHEVKGARGTWSRDHVSGDRVLVTLWDEQIDLEEKSGILRIDLNKIHPRHDPERKSLPRNRKHMARAERLMRVKRGDAKLDVVILFGKPGRPVREAMPWHPDEQFGRTWHVTAVRSDDGFFKVETR